MVGGVVDEEHTIAREPFWRARAARRSPLLIAVAATAAVLTLLLSLAAGLAGRGPTVEVRQAFDSVSASHRSVTVSSDASRVSGAQKQRIDALIARDFGRAPVRTVRATPGGNIRWTVSPRVAELVPADLAALQRGFTRFPPDADHALADSGGSTAFGSGESTTATIRQAVQVVGETAVVPLGILGVAGAIAIAMLGRLLVVSRSDEDRLLRFRGASGTELTARAAQEALAVSVPAVIVGSLVAQAVLLAMIGPPVGVAEVAAPPLAALLITVVALTAVALPSAVRSLADDDASGRGGGVTIGILAVALVVLGAICAWRYRGAADASAVIHDPLALAAPSVVLCALAAVAAALFAPISRAVAARTGRARRLDRVLAVRLMARGSAVLAAPALLIALAVATGTLAAGATATSRSFIDDAARLQNGGAARIVADGGTITTGVGDLLPLALRRTANADPDHLNAAPVLRSDGMISDIRTAVVGVRADGLPRLVPVDARRFDAAAADAALTPAAPAGIELRGERVTAVVDSKGARSATAAPASTAQASTPTATVTLWLVDRAGDAAPVSLPSVPIGATSTVSAHLPAGGTWRVAAADIDIQSDVAAAGITVDVRSLAVDGTPVAASPVRWAAQPNVFGNPAGRATTPSIGVSVSSVAADVAGGTLVRVMPVGPDAVPVVISEALADQTGLRVGERTAVDGQVAGFTARVAQIVPVVPGTDGGAAMLADLPRLVTAYLAVSQQLPTAREAWTATPVADAATLMGGAAGVTVEHPSTELEARFVQASATALWLAAAGAATFAALTLAATIAALQRIRRREVEVLRELGVGAVRQARIRVAEPAAAVLFAVVTGGVAGLLATLLIAPAVARTSAPSAPAPLPVGISVDGVGLALLIGVFVVASLGLLVAQYRMTRREASEQRPVTGASS